MLSEDSKLLCAVVPDLTPAGCTGPCYAISGINSGLWPAEFAAISVLPQSQRLPAVRAFYLSHYWNNWLARLASDEIAKRVFDFSVNGGSGTAVKTLQQAVNALGGNLALDGGWGPMTLAAANSADQAALAQAFIAARVAHYRAIVAVRPADTPFLNGWIARAQKN
jgi:hypothetical protein